MVNSDKSIFEYKIPPLVQCGAVIATIFVFMCLSFLGGVIGIADVDGGTPWLIAVSMIFFYSIGNSILSLASDDMNKYWWQSILGYVLIAFMGGSLAYLFSGDHMSIHGTYQWLYVMFAIGHIFFLALTRTMKKVVTIAKEQDGRFRGEE